MNQGALADLLAITATHEAHAWTACVIAGAAAAFVPVLGGAKRPVETRAREAVLLAGGLAGAALGATVLPMLLRLPAAIATRSTGPLFVGDRMAIGALLGFAAMVALVERLRARSASNGPREGGALRALDALAPSLGVLVVLGRIGCFLEGCDFGAPSSLPWAIRYPAGSHAFDHQLARGLVQATDGASLAVHPAQLYEAIVGVAMIVAAVVARRARSAREGDALRVTLATYAIGRFVIELFRGDERGALGPFSVPQWMAIAMLAWCAAGLVTSDRSPAEPDA